MNKFRTILIVGVVGLSIGTLTIGCSTAANDRYPTATKDGARLTEKKVRFKGTVVYHRDHGGYYTIVSDTGEEYYPIDLAVNYRMKGLRVQVYGETKGFYTWAGKGRPLAVYEIGAL